MSYFDLPSQAIEVIYQFAGFAVSAAAIWLGVAKDWTEVINTGITFFALFLSANFYDWWWGRLPKYLFFLAIGLSAILIFLLFMRIRNGTTGPAAIRQRSAVCDNLGLWQSIRAMDNRG